MSHFYGTISKSSRKNPATARGTANTGLTVEAASMKGKIKVSIFHDAPSGEDQFVISQNIHDYSGNGIEQIIATGTIGEKK